MVPSRSGLLLAAAKAGQKQLTSGVGRAHLGARPAPKTPTAMAQGKSLPQIHAVTRARLMNTSAATPGPAAPAPASAAAASAAQTQNAAEDAKTETEEERRKRVEAANQMEAYWFMGLAVFFVGSIVAYFWRGTANTKRRKKLEVGLQEKLALAPDEIDELWKSNALRSAQFELLRMRLLKDFPDGKARPVEFFEHAKKLLTSESSSLKSEHLIERLGLSMAAKAETYDLKVLLTALTLLIDVEPAERSDILFRLFSHASKADLATAKMTEAQAEEAVDALLQSGQLPVRCMVREHHSYPTNEYSYVSPLSLMTRGAEEILKTRKKESKTNPVQGHEEAIVQRLQGDLKREEDPDGPDYDGKARAADPSLQEPLWSRQDFQDLLLTYRICAWGECNK
ncbi:Hypothetical Protein FCC1311_075912 [Hondaea fermentalgiana]|uniref:Uncharacterized protein n=1 Tax=Hondaea fermentalgiana TaxID=2315210 RepID=A0A2R5GKG0_9STRA|nr:Hypothetical Protein FCC1311_075912 [Hondaea fermentalgiana]|eukprot:GBG31367.1 Hypothetical Protein FCC1311_075912 [Hondaea fermentalgiana]